MPRVASSTSCYTCRKRKLKCDERLPTCARCSKTGLICDRSSRLLIKRIVPGGVSITDDAPRDLLKQPHIADLFHTYIKHLAPWYDLSDRNCTFAQEAPTRALDSPLLFAAIVAFAGCFSARTSSSSLAIAEAYHTRCLRFLISLSPADEAVQNGTALAATCLLRSYEILSEVEDPNRHLFGASTLLPPQTPALNDGSLRAGAFWNYLREDITYSLIHGCPLKIEVGRCLDNAVTASNLSNAMTLLMARTINIYFNEKEDPRDVQILKEDMMLCWHTHQPQPFAYYHKETDDFPTIKMLTDTQVAAHHYNKVIQCMLMDQNRAGLAAEICSLAMSSLSNAVVVNAYGPICFTGQWLETASQRNALVKWLYDTQKRTAWSVNPIIEKLGKAWGKTKTQS